jgi:hypothetical protein
MNFQQAPIDKDPTQARLGAHGRFQLSDFARASRAEEIVIQGILEALEIHESRLLTAKPDGDAIGQGLPGAR